MSDSSTDSPVAAAPADPTPVVPVVPDPVIVAAPFDPYADAVAQLDVFAKARDVAKTKAADLSDANAMMTTAQSHATAILTDAQAQAAQMIGNAQNKLAAAQLAYQGAVHAEQVALDAVRDDLVALAPKAA